MSPRLLPLALLLLVSLPAIAQQQPPGNEIALSVGRSELNQLGDAPAAGISYNRFWVGGVSTRFGVFMAREDDNGRTKRIGAYHVSGEYHFLRGRSVSPYLGFGFAMTSNSIEDSENDFSASESTPKTILSGGLDVNISPRFALGADVRYIYYDVELGSRFGYQLNPTTVLVSAKFRY